MNLSRGKTVQRHRKYLLGLDSEPTLSLLSLLLLSLQMPKVMLTLSQKNALRHGNVGGR